MRNEANDECPEYQEQATGLTAAMPRVKKSLTVGKRGPGQGGRVVTAGHGLSWAHGKGNQAGQGRADLMNSLMTD